MLPVGSLSPRVVLPDQHGVDVTLGRGEPAGAQFVVFFPAAFTPVCGGELKRLRDDLVPTLDAGVSLVAVSCDSTMTLRAFADAEGIRFPLLSDFWPHGAASTVFDAFDEEFGTARRATYLVDGDGVIRWGIVNGLPDARDVADYRTALAEFAS